MSRRAGGGFTLIELMIVIAVVAILAAVAIPWLLQARIAANEAAAITALHAINDAQSLYRQVCGKGRYAAALTGLGRPMPATGQAFISPDLAAADRVQKSGYDIAMQGTASAEDATTGCNDAPTATGYYVTADPSRPGRSGARYFATNVTRVIYQHTETFMEQMPASGAPGIGTELK
jgi:prepilin-type N-terminal cleavage/methylation domain-containing protein